MSLYVHRFHYTLKHLLGLKGWRGTIRLPPRRALQAEPSAATGEVFFVGLQGEPLV